MNLKIFLFILLTFLIISATEAQEYTAFYTRTLDINRSGMYFLGGWALANMATGAYGSLAYEGESKYFHQMNAAWNLVNAGIATYALFEIAGTDIAGLSGEDIMKKHIRTENIFLFNAGLDILYMAGGAWMVSAASKYPKRYDLMRGYGKSIILQGAFLFLFDLAKFGIQYNHRQVFQDSAVKLGFTPDGLSVVVGF
jgi:hypothetical protein